MNEPTVAALLAGLHATACEDSLRRFKSFVITGVPGGAEAD